MSIENFCMRFPADPSIRPAITNIRDAEGKSNKSLVVVFAEQLAREGRNGLKVTMDKLSGSNTMFRLDQESFNSLSDQDKSSLFENYEAIVFGNVVASLERTLVNGEYDHEEFCEDLNLQTDGLQLGKAEAGTKKREKLSKEHMSKMYSVAGGDKTLLGFLEKEGDDALPSTLREFLESRNLLHAIRRDILPICEPRVNFLVSS